MNIIELNQLTKHYKSNDGFLKKKTTTVGIDEISFSVKEGEIFGFIGPNGAGKSTTIRTLLSLIYPTKGSATIFGKDCVKDSYEILKEVGYLPSEVFSYDDMKIIELLKYSASFYKKDCSENIKIYTEAFELNLNKKFDELSFGNKKKVGIVLALIHDPKLLILDEPTSGLDPLMQKTFFEILEQKNKQGTTILFSSHILSEVQKICNRVAIIKEGKIIRIEEIDALNDTNYKKIRVESKSNITQKNFVINGITDFKQDDRFVTFIYKGDMNSILATLSQIDIKNLIIEDPTLEEIFMHYYV